MIFYGPSGVGKTTLAQIIASQTNRKLYKLNATPASTSDIKSIINELDTLLAPQGVLLYLDEIQYFNKKQQQSLLEYIENGKITREEAQELIDCVWVKLNDFTKVRDKASAEGFAGYSRG